MLTLYYCEKYIASGEGYTTQKIYICDTGIEIITLNIDYKIIVNFMENIMGRY